LPIVREGDFRTDAIVLPRVVIDSRLRTTLRIYSPEPDPIQVRIEIADWWYDSVDNARLITLAAGDELHPAFGQLVLEHEFSWLGPVHIRIVPLPFGEKQPRIWAFMTMVDNATNEVTVITPQ
jgi:hypothetical protein